MARQILAVTALLAVFVACRDGPAELAAPVEARVAPQPDVTVSVDAVRTVVNLLDDPFVHELMDMVGPRIGESLHSAVRDPSVTEAEGGILALSRILTAARSQLLTPADGDAVEENPDAVILRAALVLVLDDAATLLEKPLPSEEREKRGRDVVQH